MNVGNEGILKHSRFFFNCVSGFDLGVNKQLMNEVSGLSLGPPRLPVMPCPVDQALAIAQKYHSLFSKN